MSCRSFLFTILFFTVFTSPALAQHYDASFESPIVDAANRGDKFEVARLLRAGISPNTKGGFNTTALMRAAYLGNVEVARLLIDNGASVNDRDIGGATALHIAARRGNSAIVELLIKHGANPDIKDKEGFDPTSRAAKSNHLKIVNKIQRANATTPTTQSANSDPIINKHEHKQIVTLTAPSDQPETIIHLEPDYKIEHVTLAPLDTHDTHDTGYIGEASLPITAAGIHVIPAEHEYSHPPYQRSTVQDLRSLVKPKVIESVDDDDEEDSGEDHDFSFPQLISVIHGALSPDSQPIHTEPVGDNADIIAPLAEIELVATPQPKQIKAIEPSISHNFIEIPITKTQETEQKPKTPPAGLSVAEAVKLPDDIDLHKDFHLIKRSHLQKPDWVSAENSGAENSWIEVTGLTNKQNAIHFWQELTRDEYFQGSVSKLVVGKTAASPAKLHIGRFTNASEALQTCSVVRKQNSRLLCYVLKEN